MALLKSWRTNPPGTWRHHQSETEFEMKAENGDALVDMVVAHRIYRNLPRADRASVKLDVQRQICISLSRGDCKSEGSDDPWVPADKSRPLVTMARVIAFSRAAFEFLKSGARLVPREVALERAAICKGCVENRKMTGCNCGNYHKLIAASIPAERKIDGLDVCFRCGCDLTSKVNLEDSVILASNKGQKIEYPSFCWQRKIIEAQENLPPS